MMLPGRMSTPLIFMDLAYGKELGLPHAGG
jgi:hypothetical protein